MIPRLRNVAVDCNDLDAMVRIWSELLSYEVPARGETEATLAANEDARSRLCFRKVPEPRAGKSRVHLDLLPVASDPA